MLSRAEREFIVHPDSVSKKYAAVLKIRINRKILNFKKKVDLANADLSLIASHHDLLQISIIPLVPVLRLDFALQETCNENSKNTDEKTYAINVLANNSFA
ncbi:MAG: hypothetical protein KGH87_01080 [Thaumarchaeota archaeon]|nr:hypothetical protein [Nitrososphaerota archaeon]MDE1838489.1 hypothetical protein [Nitrososphaerota archaeon]